MKLICQIIILVFWPYYLYQNNPNDWFLYVLPALVLFLVHFSYYKFQFLTPFFYLTLPIIHPAYLAIPTLGIVTLFINQTKKFVKISYLLLFITISIFCLKPFINHSVFINDPLKKDFLIKKISIVPNRYLSKIYENKTTIPTQKYISNIFLTLDLNNYFFAFHPREIIGENQNLQKFPSIAIVPFIFGLFTLFESKNQKIKKTTLTLLSLSILSLSFINNLDKFDFILYVPILIITILGTEKLFSNKNYFLHLSLLALFIFSAAELLKNIILRLNDW